MYDMYTWDRPASSGGDDGRTVTSERQHRPAVPIPHPAHPDSRPRARSRRAVVSSAAPGVRAVQVALDRRDNGGDASPTRDQ